MDLSGISTEDLLALKGGDLSKVSTQGLQALRHASTAQQIDNDPISQGARNFTEGMSTGEKFTAGAGKAFSDLALGVKQRTGFASRDDVKESRKLDAPLMRTGAGIAGNIGANLTMLAPASLIPGAATVPGAAALGGAIGFLQPSASVKEDVVNTGMGAAGGAIGQYGANLAGDAAANQVVQNVTKTTQNAQKTQAAQNASKAGLVIPPEDIGQGGGVVTKLLSGTGGKIKTAQVASQQNQPVINALAKQELGLKADDVLTPQVLQGIRNQAGQAYDAIKSSGTITADKVYTDALDKIGNQFGNAAKAFPGAVKSDIPDLVAAMKQPTFSAEGAVDMTKVLRQQADKAFTSGDKDLGKAMKSAADALEGMMERHLQAAGSPDALKAFQDARQLIAKTYSVQKGLNATTGDVAASALTKQLEKQRPLSGNLLTIAEAGQSFPRATQTLKEAPKSISPLDMAFALSHAAGGHGLNLLTLGARPAARSILLSKPMQQSALNSAMTPQQANPLLRLMSQEEVALPVGMASSNALASYLLQK